LVFVAVCALIYAITMHRKRKAAKALYDKTYQESVKAMKDIELAIRQQEINAKYNAERTKAEQGIAENTKVN